MFSTPDAPGDAVSGAQAAVIIKPGYDWNLVNEDLAPLRKQDWGAYAIFAF